MSRGTDLPETFYSVVIVSDGTGSRRVAVNPEGVADGGTAAVVARGSPLAARIAGALIAVRAAERVPMIRCERSSLFARSGLPAWLVRKFGFLDWHVKVVAL